MRRYLLQILLALSLLLNLGILGAVGYQSYRSGHLPSLSGNGKNQKISLSDYLHLTPEQDKVWREKEIRFKQEINESWQDVRDHRERMIWEIFSAQPDLAAIEADRAEIARLQEKQQRRVIEQLLVEQGILTPKQRGALADLLIGQIPAGSMEERLHGN